MKPSFLSRLNPFADYHPKLVPLLIGLLFMSGFMTWKGVHGFITHGAGDAANQIAYFGSIAVVAVLTLAMFSALNFLLQPSTILKFFLAFVVYVLLALFSVGFGYGFWWELFSAKTETDSKIEESFFDLDNSVENIKAKLEGLKEIMQSSSKYSDEKSVEEHNIGNTCGDGSKRGDGDRRKYRKDTADNLAMTAQFIDEWYLDISKRIEIIKQQKSLITNGYENILINVHDKPKNFDNINRKKLI